MEFCASLEQIVKFTLPALLQLKAEGKVRYIGLTGYSLETLQRLVSLLPPDTVNTVLTYCRCTLVDQALLDVLQFFEDRKIGVINASPVSMGLLSKRGPPAWHPATENIKWDPSLPSLHHCHANIVTLRNICRQAALYCQEQGEDVTDLAILWTLTLKSIPTTLISTANINNMMR